MNKTSQEDVKALQFIFDDQTDKTTKKTYHLDGDVKMLSYKRFLFTNQVYSRKH